MHRPDASLRRRIARLSLVAVAFLGFLLGLVLALDYLVHDPLSDVRAYYDAGARLNAGIPLYDQSASTNEAAFYRYPPLLAIVFRPLALLPYEVAAVAWETLVIATFVLTLHHVGFRRQRTWILVGLLGIGIGWSLSIGQAQVPVTYLVALGSPLSIALAGQIKVLPVLVAVWWIGRGDWHALRRFVAWSGALIVLQLVLEPAGTLAFPASFGLSQVGDVRNWSPYAISPWLWAGLVVIGTVVALRLSRTRYGWAAAVALSVLATPRLLTYQLMTLLSAAREPATSAVSASVARATPSAIRAMPGSAGSGPR